MLIVEKLAAILCLKPSLKVEEERKQGWDGGEASESLYAAALDHGDGGSPLTRKNGTSGSQRSPSTDSKEQDG